VQANTFTIYTPEELAKRCKAAHRTRLAREEKARREQLQQLLDIGGWEEVIEGLAEMAREEYEVYYRPHAEKLADALDKIANELW